MTAESAFPDFKVMGRLPESCILSNPAIYIVPTVLVPHEGRWLVSLADEALMNDSSIGVRESFAGVFFSSNLLWGHRELLGVLCFLVVTVASGWEGMHVFRQ